MLLFFLDIKVKMSMFICLIVEKVPSGPAAPIREFDPPGSAGDGNDWVLVLKAVR